MRILALLSTIPAALLAATLNIGPGFEFERIEHALAAAQPNDTLLVHPREDNAPYEKTALFLEIPVTLRAAATNITLDGAGFNYSGAGRVPRAIAQFEPGASGSVLDGFVLANARNDSRNGAGVRINRANNITITNCVIRNNDIGAMSNGDATQNTATNQLFIHCVITRNGLPEPTGFSSNLYLGGTEVTLRFCEVSHSRDGHNLKSRAHITRVEDCLFLHAANREFDLVDGAGDTDVPNSDAFLIRNTIVKHPATQGNGNVIHFGRDGAADHTGTLYAVSNIIVSTYPTAIVDLSSTATARLHHNIVTNSHPQARLLSLRHPNARAFGSENDFPKNLTLDGLTGWDE